MKTALLTLTLETADEVDLLANALEGRLEIAEDDKSEERHALRLLRTWLDDKAPDGCAFPVVLDTRQLTGREASALAMTLENMAEDEIEPPEGAPAWARVAAHDERGKAFAYGAQWAYSLGDDSAHDGERVTCAKALEIAADALEAQARGCATTWSGHELRIALGVLAGIRAQRGCEDWGAEYLTHCMDLAIYG